MAAQREPEAVTVVVTRQVRSGCESAYEAWLARLTEQASVLPGFLGAKVEKPSALEPRTYTSVFRFDSVVNLRAFEQSELRRRALREVVDLVEADAFWSRLTGLELWFTPPPETLIPQPSRFRMALVMIAVVYGLVLSIGKLVALVLGATPQPVRLLVTITIEVFLMTYVLMPRLTRWLARWIYPQKVTP
ncbi:MAG: antibiotic biosynthesis monooxygenase [Deltaproteobacteria bacterium]|nr:antibiotic biosynthesis monooxygenase [Deltaproteobacteria bacterium]